MRVSPIRTFFAPGRVNLIGEHTDYNEGFVLPMAIECGTFVSGRAREDRTVRVFSHYLNEDATFDLDADTPPQRGIWLDFIEGITSTLESEGCRLRGADLEIKSTVPIGGGLSSSTALDMAVALAMLRLSEIEFDKRRLALMSQKSNHTYVGTRGGLMDQLTILFGQRNHALLIDCRSLEIKPIPFATQNVAVAICNTNVKHNLVASEYNARRAECETGVERLKKYLPHICALRDVSVEEFGQYENALPEIIRRRARHVITENVRTLAAAGALGANDFEKMGELMYASHASLRDDYEVSCKELDALVEIASQTEGVIGARMTGGGFGGCTVNLVKREALAQFQKRVAREYEKATGSRPMILISEASAGASEVES
ncbi:MAG: galactokinase [Acidobacteriota bacterium]